MKALDEQKMKIKVIKLPEHLERDCVTVKHCKNPSSARECRKIPFIVWFKKASSIKHKRDH